MQFEKPVSKQVLRSMVGRLTARGPDDEGYILQDSVALGHRRLSVLDLSKAGHQPMVDGSTGNVIVYNGELYNYREIRQLLRNLGVRFESECDTEVILKAYGQWGAAALNYFIGMFAFAIWDPRRHGLLLARDRLGIKPLYYFKHEETLGFASRLGALAQHPDCPKTVSKTSLQRYFQLGFVPGPLSMLERVHKLKPGHTLWIPLGRLGGKEDIKSQPYWTIGGNVRTRSEGMSTTDQADALEPLLTDAVSKRMIADVPVGVLLSGGIDSSTVASLAASQTENLSAFSIGFDDQQFDELRIAKDTANKLGLEHHSVTMSGQDLLNYLPRYADSYDEPFADPSGLPTLAVAELARQSVTVVLTGDGGDELFGGYPIYSYLNKVLAFRKLPSAIQRASAAMLQIAPGRRLNLLGTVLTKPDAAQAFLFMRSISKNTESPLLDSEQTPEADWIYEDMLWEEHPGGAIKGAAEFDMHYYMTDGILQKVDVASMSFGLEARVPLLDHRVVELAGTFPMACDGKAALKHILARHIPDFDFNRPKQGFSIPLARWIREDLRDHFRDMLAPAELAKAPFLDIDKVGNLLAMHLDGKCDVNRTLWAVLCYVQWCRIFRPRA